MKPVAIPEPAIESRILVVRGHRVMLDSELAKLYGVRVKVINQAVKRNADRFPADFMFQLGWDELGALRSQTVTLNERPCCPRCCRASARSRSTWRSCAPSFACAA